MVISMKRTAPNWIDIYIYIYVCVCLCCPLFSYEHVINKCGSSIFRVIGSHEKSGALQQTQSTQLRKLPGHGCDRFGLSPQSRFGPKLPEPWCCDCLYNDLPEITEIVLGTAGYIMNIYIYIYTDMMMMMLMMMMTMMMMMLIIIIVMRIVILIVIIMMTTITIILMMIITILVTIYITRLLYCYTMIYIYIYNDRDFLGVPGSKEPVSVGSPDLFVNIGGVAIYELRLEPKRMCWMFRGPLMIPL